MGSSADAYVRADKIDLTSLDIQLEQRLTKKWGKADLKSQGPKADWEIDLAKLEIRYVIAQGTYGTVYRGTYDGQEVAGIYLSIYLSRSNSTMRICHGIQFLAMRIWFL
jgi:hypothetical protein